MIILYDVIFLFIALVYFPIYLFKGKFHQGLFSRLGLLPKNLELDKPIWVHAVSVGEVMAVRGLIEGLRRLYPSKKFVISTVTPTGNKIAKGIAKEGDFTTYLPLDFSFIVGSVTNRINPSIFVIAETEIWPNLLSCLHKKNIPVIIVNGRISDNSFRGYLIIKLLIKSIMNKVSMFCVQTVTDAERLKALGVREGKIKVTGNMKFDINDYTDFKKDYTDFRKRLGLGYDNKLLVAGSTHSGEEEIILGVYKKLLNDLPYLRLLLAPRHPQRAKDVIKLTGEYGFNCFAISQLNSKAQESNIPKTVFILDSIGQLLFFYSIADIVFIGGSLIKKGGHNILEPAFLSKPILFGPFMQNFRDISELFLNNKAAIQVKNETELIENIKTLLKNPEQAAQLGQRARDLVSKNSGATAKNLEFIKSIYMVKRKG